MTNKIYWFCTKHQSVGNTNYCAKCVQDFIENFKNLPWVKIKEDETV